MPHLELQSRTQYLEESKEIKQNWTETKKNYICFFIIFHRYNRSFISGRETGY